ncbi:unnamed protein product [Heligmosomoides polygyrus]|uniref:Secreted protein n=1 Tax=Heligmosomoides polygyrus TaxID=6339 RepID=A0A183F7R0_HELPZ|nr:unnamed protein product [Heligmosomoides polygyrus]
MLSLLGRSSSSACRPVVLVLAQAQTNSTTPATVAQHNIPEPRISSQSAQFRKGTGGRWVSHAAAQSIAPLPNQCTFEQTWTGGVPFDQGCA